MCCSLSHCLPVLSTSSAMLASERIGGPRLRPQDPRIIQVLQEGMARSATFRALVDRIEASNVIVYVAVSPMLKSSLSGALTWMTRAGDFRYVRASISTEQTFDQMIATVAHELQHAVEVIEDESVDRRDEPRRALQADRPAQTGRRAARHGRRSPRSAPARRSAASWSRCRQRRWRA